MREKDVRTAYRLDLSSLFYDLDVVTMYSHCDRRSESAYSCASDCYGEP